MIWDFRGPHAEKTADHHIIHLKEFAQNNQITNVLFGVEKIYDNYTIAYMVVTEDLVTELRKTLKPHRGQWYQD